MNSTRKLPRKKFRATVWNWLAVVAASVSRYVPVNSCRYDGKRKKQILRGRAFRLFILFCWLTLVLFSTTTTQCKLPNKKKTNESTSPTDTAASASTAIVATTSKRTTRSGRTIKQPAAPTALAKPTTPKHFIEKDSIRVGSLDDVAGSYGRWNHLPCWRVPSRIWSGLSQPDNKDIVLQDLLHMDEVLLTGLADLDADEQATFVEHVMDRSHWAKKYKYKKKKQATKKRPAATKQESDTDNKRAKKTSGPKGATKEEDDENEENASTAIVASKERFVTPRPGVDGALAADDLEGKRFVLTGVFPEVGGGAGLNMGKDKVKQMIEDFGGRVTGSVSGKTDYLVVGKEPGASKVKKAHDRGLPLIDLRTLQSMLLGQTSFLEANEKAPPKIESFSAGYPNRMIAY